MAGISLDEWRAVINPDAMLYPPPDEMRREHEQAIGDGHCASHQFGCEIVVAFRGIFGWNKWPSVN